MIARGLSSAIPAALRLCNGSAIPAALRLCNGSAMPATFALDPRDPIFAAAAATSTSGNVLTDDALVGLIETRLSRAGQPNLEITRELLNKTTGPLKASRVSKWDEHGLYRSCLWNAATSEWRCEYLVCSSTERVETALRFALKDPPFQGLKAFAADGSGARRPPPAPKAPMKRRPSRTPGASGCTPKGKRANFFSPGARNNEEDGNDYATLLCGQVTDRRAKFLKECADKSEMLVRRAARTDDSQMVALHEVFLLPLPTIFHDDDADEDRVTIDVVFKNGTGYLLETARLDSGGIGHVVRDGALYSLADADREDLGRMIATYTLRGARRAAGPGRAGAPRDAAAPRAAAPPAAGPPAAAPPRSRPKRDVRRPAGEDVYMY
ncbi:hypothetical protein M885DRAFT_340109 [Pelagophyceae sp. CCMP2097]|nr:hypothetical protein M885DRAFT_340109 [Pelagophyceae sp. CCMP2097]